jgi:hypothetical protein
MAQRVAGVSGGDSAITCDNASKSLPVINSVERRLGQQCEQAVSAGACPLRARCDWATLPTCDDFSVSRRA